VAETKNGLLAVPAGDFNVSRSLLMSGEYDWPQITWLNALLGAASRVVFAGAHIGALLIPIVRHSATRGVVAYEPSPRNFRLLSMNLQLNGIDGVVTFNTARGERCGDARSHHCAGLGFDRSHRDGHGGQRGRSDARRAVYAGQDPKSLC